MTKAAVHSVETFGSVDGPGIRFIIFLKGCKLRCRYCHNPDTWNPDSKDMRSADELLEQALKYRTYWGKKGGITVSGGEALLQMDFMIELFKKAKKLGIHTCIDTAAQPFTREEPFFSKFNELMEYMQRYTKNNEYNLFALSIIGLDGTGYNGRITYVMDNGEEKVVRENGVLYLGDLFQDNSQ